MADNPFLRALRAMRQAEAKSRWEDAVRSVEQIMARMKAAGTPGLADQMADELEFLNALGPEGYAVVRGDSRPQFLDDAPAVATPAPYDQDSDDDGPTLVIEISVSDDGAPLVWSREGWSDEDLYDLLCDACELYERDDEEDES